MRHQYRITWMFPDGYKLIRLVRFTGWDAANRAARAPEYYRDIFRRAGLYDRSTGEYEYLDRFPTPSNVIVETTGE